MNMLIVIKTRDQLVVCYVFSVNIRFTPFPHMFIYVVIYFNDAVVRVEKAKVLFEISNSLGPFGMKYIQVRYSKGAVN